MAAEKLVIAQEAVEQRVLAHIEKNIADKSRAKQFIKVGLDLVQADCPFCGQDLKIAAELIEAYRKFIDDAFRIFQTRLAQATSQLDKWNIDNELTGLISSHNANTNTIQHWEQYIGIAELSKR